MLDTGKIVGFVATTDYERARGFYEGKLGCEILATDQYAMVAALGGHSIRIVKIPDFTPVNHTVMGWEVADIKGVVGWLKAKGVEFEHYPWIQDQQSAIWVTPSGDEVAWFKDPDGNVLSVSQHARA